MYWILGLSLLLSTLARSPTLGVSLVLASLLGCNQKATPTRLASDSTNVAPTSLRQILNPVLVGTSDPELEFVNIMSIDVDSHGNIYVADWADPAVTILTPDGHRLVRIGRRGDGPGEFQNVKNVQILPGDTLFVFDRGLSRATTFAPLSGIVVNTVTLTGLGLTFPIQVLRAFHQPTLFATYAKAYTGRERPTAPQRMQVLKIVGVDGTLLKDSVMIFPDYSQLLIGSRGGFSIVENPFARHGVLSISVDDEIYFGWTDSTRITIFSLDGVRRRSLEFSAIQAPVTNVDIDAASARLSPEFHRAIQDSAPPTWPTMREMVVDEQGQTWLGLVGAHGRTDEWIVIGKSGRVLGALKFPPTFRLYQVRAQLAYGVLKDSLDVPTVAVFQLGELPIEDLQ